MSINEYLIKNNNKISELQIVLPTLSKKCIEILLLRLHGRTIDVIAKHYNVSRERIRQIQDKAEKKLFLYLSKINIENNNLNTKINLYKNDINSTIKKLDEENTEICFYNTSHSLSMHNSIIELDLSCRPYNCLKRRNINKIKDLTDLTIIDLIYFNYLGKNSIIEIVEKINKYGFKLKLISKEQITDFINNKYYYNQFKEAFEKYLEYQQIIIL